MVRARIIIHLPTVVLLGEERLKPFYSNLRDGLLARGIGAEYAPHDRASLPGEVAEDQNFHIADHGSFRHPRVLNSAIAYVQPFWHLDPWGVRSATSIGARTFPAGEMQRIRQRVDLFHQRLTERLVEARTSRYPQPEAQADFPDGCIAVFLQSDAHRSVEETCYLDRETMLTALLARPDPRPIVVKIHPRDPSPETRDWLTREAASDPRLIVTEANIHDILSKAAVTVTINSAVGLESMIHGVPVVLCGRADFHHAAMTVESPGALDGAIAEAERRPWPHAAYLYWYFRLNCLSAPSKSLVDDVLARIAATGFDLARFRLDN